MQSGLLAALVVWIGVTAEVVALAAPASATDLIIESARVQDARLHLTVRNEGPTESRPLSVALTTRAGGFMVGTAAHPLPVLSPGARHVVQLPLPIWAPERSDLISVITQRGCCTTRVVLLPADLSVEIEHLLPLPLPNVSAESGPAPASEDSP